MKIILIGTAHPFRGGLASFNERLMTQFQEEGHEVMILNFTLQYPSFLFPGKTQFSDSPAPENLHSHAAQEGQCHQHPSNSHLLRQHRLRLESKFY